jgi:carboxyl-terminal processing protease
MKIPRPSRLTISTLILIGLAMVLVPLSSSCALAGSPDYRQLRLFRNVMNIIQENYVKEVSEKELIQGAINGMLQSLDPHSSFMTADQFHELQLETSGEFEGVGIEITLENGILTIISPIEDTPGYRAGLKAGDKIVKINGESTKNITLQKAVKKMRGPRGTSVTITVARKGFVKFKDFTITRGLVHIQSIKDQMLEPGYAYVRIVTFQDNTAKHLKSAIADLAKKGEIKGMILDLRNNPGGLLDQATKVANLFIDKGLIVYTDGRVKAQHMHVRAKTAQKLYDFKTAVLINQGSASASEIVAGAMQDNDRALIFGTKSFGKASVQTIMPLEDGTGLRLTTAYYYTPKGRHIQKKGIQPDVDLKKEVEEEQEKLLEEELKNRNKKKDKKNSKISRFRKETKEDLLKDAVVKSALDWLKSQKTVKEFKKEQKKPSAETAFRDTSEK